MRENNSLSVIDSLFDCNPFTLFDSFNSVWENARARMDELMNDPNTKTYTSPDGTTTICYNSKTLNGKGNCINSRAKKEIVYNDYPITDVYTDGPDGDGDYIVVVHFPAFIPGYTKDQIYVDFKNNYLNIYATRDGAWKDVLVKAKDGVTYVAPEISEEERGKKEIKNFTYIQKQSKDVPYIAEQHVLVDTTKYDITKLTKSFENNILTIRVPAKEETKPALLTFNE